MQVITLTWQSEDLGSQYVGTLDYGHSWFSMISLGECWAVPVTQPRVHSFRFPTSLYFQPCYRQTLLWEVQSSTGKGKGSKAGLAGGFNF